MELDPHQRDFIDDFASLWDQLGGVAIQGRMVALLYISDQAELTAPDIAEALGVSRGTVSQVTRELVRMRLIQRVSRPGDRRDYFRVNPNAWYEASRSRLVESTSFLELLHRGIRVRVAGSPEGSRALVNAARFLEDYSAAMAEFLRTWKPPNDVETS